MAWVVWGVGTNVSDLKLLNQINSYLSEQSSSWLQSQLFLAHYNRSKLKTDFSQNQKKKLSTKKKKDEWSNECNLIFFRLMKKTPYSYSQTTFFAIFISFFTALKSKVHILWEGHKISRNLHQLFDWQYIGQIISGDYAKFCGLLRIYEL